MRTHRLVVSCAGDNELANQVEDLLQDEFCDLTHWYNGLTDEGEDTPDHALIYRGAYNKNKVYVEFDSSMYSTDLVDRFLLSLCSNTPVKFGDCTLEKLDVENKVDVLSAAEDDEICKSSRKKEAVIYTGLALVLYVIVYTALKVFCT